MEEEIKKQAVDEIKDETSIQGFANVGYKDDFQNSMVQMINSLNDARFNSFETRLSVLEAKLEIIEKIFVK